jgi:hypothetical protein
MSDTAAVKYKMHLTVFGVLLAIWGAFGWMDVQNYAQGGWNTDGNNTVTQVLPGSPAEAGGLQAGDFIQSLGGISTTDAKAMSRRGRPKIGETWEFVVERDGAVTSLDVTFGEPVAQRKLIAHAGFVAGFCFLGFALFAYMKKQTEATMALALTGTFFSLFFLNGPYFEGYMMRSVFNALTWIIVFMGVASMWYFLLVYPTRSAYLDKPNARRMLYAPGLVAGLFVAYRILATPEATAGLNTFANIFVGGIASAYFIGSLITVYKSFSGASAADRDSQGLNLLLVGTLVGILPFAAGLVVNVFAPQVVLPGQNFYFLAFILIPITWSMAVLKGASAPEQPAEF